MKSLWNSFKAAFAMFSKIPMPMVDYIYLFRLPRCVRGAGYLFYSLSSDYIPFKNVVIFIISHYGEDFNRLFKNGCCP